MAQVAPQRDPAAYRAMKADRLRRERLALREAQKAEFQRQKQEALDAEKKRRIESMQAAAKGNPEAPMWAQVRQCYVEHRPAQIMHERQMRRCHGGSVMPVHTGRQTCLSTSAIDALVGAA